MGELHDLIYRRRSHGAGGGVCCSPPGRRDLDLVGDADGERSKRSCADGAGGVCSLLSVISRHM